MCGIIGCIDYWQKTNKKVILNMIETLHHRGPDDSGIEFINNKSYNVGLAHKRLSILDLSKRGHQPYIYRNLIMVYNGEVYNFLEIKKELEDLGYSFESNSDSEVIIKSFHAWQEKAIEKFNGMFAIAIYDKTKEKLSLIRDRAGVKPLYYYFKNDLFMFASELKAFHKHPRFDKTISNDAVFQYFKYGSIYQPNSIFKYVRKVKNGEIVTLDLKSKKIDTFLYWDIKEIYNQEKLVLNEEEALTELDSIINSSVKYRMISDVPLGSFLSGGYDSSLVTAIMQKNSNEKIKTFTIGFENEKYNEAKFAKVVANYLETNHTEYICTAKDAKELLANLADILDEPMADSSIIPTLIVSKITKEKVTVSLSADGGDELFAGYDTYRKVLRINQKLKRIPLRYLMSNILDFFVDGNLVGWQRKISRVSAILNSKDIVSLHDALSNIFIDSSLKRLIKFKSNDYKADIYSLSKYTHNNLDELLLKDFISTLNDQLLVKVDRATMHYSLEGREPLLDYRLIEFAARLPMELKIKNNNGKYLLKKLTHKYIPKEIMERPKMGFSVPLKDWFEDELMEMVKYFLSEEKIKKQDILNYQEVKKIKNAFLYKKDVNFRQIWSLLIFQMWIERWL